MELKLLKGMRKGSYYVIFFLIFTVFNFNVTAQNEGDVINVDMFKGKANINILLHVFKGREFDLPISMNYTTSGIKVDQVAGNVGLGWNLSAGGAVTRVTSFIPDDIDWSCAAVSADFSFNKALRTRDFYKSSAVNLDGLFRHKTVNSNIGDALGSYLNPKITAVRNNNGIESSHGNEWIVTHEDGTKYYFGQNNSLETITSKTSEFVCDTPDYTSTTSWMLTKIVSKNKLDVFEFSYVNYKWLNFISNDGNGTFSNSNGTNFIINHTEYKISQQMISEIKHNGSKIISFSYVPRNDMQFVGGLSVGNALNEIKFYNFNDANITFKKAKFNYSYFGNTNPSESFLKRRLKLDSIQIIGTKNNQEINGDLFSLEYKQAENIPDIKSYARDYLGLYNGKDDNVNLIPPLDFECARINQGYLERCEAYKRSFSLEKSLVGTLTKIIYPSKGFTTLEYEQNAKKGGYGKQYVPEKKIYGTATENLVSYYSGFDCQEDLTLVYRAQNELGFNPIMSSPNFSGLGQNLPSWTNFPPSLNTIRTRFLRVSEAESLLNLKLKANGGGIYMIQKLNSANCNPINDLVDCRGNVYWNSCMIPTSDLYYNGNQCSAPSTAFIRGGFLNDANFNLAPGDYQITMWAYLECDFSIGYDYSFYQSTIPAFTIDLDVISETVDGFRVKSISNYESIDKLVNKKSYKYIHGQPVSRVDNFSFAPAGFQTFSSKITSGGYLDDEIINYPEVFEVLQGSNNEVIGSFYNVYKPLIVNNNFDGPSRIMQNGFVQDDNIHSFVKNFPLYNTGDNIALQFNLDNGNKLCIRNTFNAENQLVNESFTKYDKANGEYMSEHDKGFFEFLEWTHNINHTKNGFIEKSYDFTYGYKNQSYYTESNGMYFNITRDTNNVTDTTYEYDFFDNENYLPGFNYLKNTVTGIDNLTTGKTKYIYTPLTNTTVTPNITRYLVSEMQHKPVNGTAMEPKTRYNYDLDGNMIEMVNVTPGTIPNNQYESYIYGYNNRFVVAKITGAKFSDIPAANITAIKSASNQIINPANNTALETALNALKSVSALANAQITTTTINPVFGPTSVTDPKGYTIYNEYDVFGRPTLTKEKNPAGGFNILSETKYNTRAN